MQHKAGLTSVVVRHVDIVANHVRHGRGHQVGFVHVQIHGDTSSLRRTHAAWDAHARFPALKLFPAATQEIEGVSNKQLHISVNRNNANLSLEWYFMQITKIPEMKQSIRRVIHHCAEII